MLSNFFLKRPVFTWVVAIIMMLAGGLAIYHLPGSQYPPIAPPSIAIDAFYAGASAETRNAMVFAFPPPAVVELGQAGGFDFQLQGRGGVGPETLMTARNQVLGMASQETRLTRVRPNGLDDVSEYRIDVDWQKAGTIGVPINFIHNTISASFSLRGSGPVFWQTEKHLTNRPPLRTT